MLQLLEKNGIEVRLEQMDGSGGGICSVKGRRIVFLDTAAPASERAAVCAAAIAKVVNLEEIYMKPEVRQFVEQENQRSR